jgi:hypothetical protein
MGLAQMTAEALMSRTHSTPRVGDANSCRHQGFPAASDRSAVLVHQPEAKEKEIAQRLLLVK